MALIRLNKYLADSGIASRRRAEQFILAGKIRVNGAVVDSLGTKVDPARDKVFFGEQIVKPNNEKPIVIMLNKPIGYVCTTRHFKGEKNVLDLIKISTRIYPVGRLDKDSSGLLILTNDGELSARLTHPRYEKEKEYFVAVDKDLEQNFVQRMSAGLILDGGEAVMPAKIRLTGAKTFSVILKQGKKRQIRRMCAVLGFRVLSLVRTRINRLQLGALPVGEYRVLKDSEIRLLK